ncbi:MAG: L-lysine 6-transaminase [Planctomycetota bacterium]|jgi:L-lysine 6-transaminase
MSRPRVPPRDVRKILERHLLVDGFPFVVDLSGSLGSWLRDDLTGRHYLDFYTFFASSPLGFNHPRFRTPEFRARMSDAATHKPANSDVMTVELAEFVAALERVAMPPDLPHLFLVEGGALAVENAMKAAFDWKVGKNAARGVEGGGGKVLHFRDAFHGRSGYTLSVTNTDPVKTRGFPKFDWPRVSNPKLSFPLTPERLRAVEEAERRSVAEIEAAFDREPHDIAAILIEPIQCEGGDHHFRAEFLRELRRIADAREALLVFDEVQTGLGVTGKMWAYEHFGLVPDILVFAKKMQVGGILCSRRIDEVADNVFAVSSRINSTWGGGLADMVRAAEILDVIEDERLVEHVARMGEVLLRGLEAFGAEFPEVVTNVRGRGLLCAFDLPTRELRGSFREACFEEELLVLACGERSIRLRPALNVLEEDIEEALHRLRKAIGRLPGVGGKVATSHA